MTKRKECDPELKEQAIAVWDTLGAGGENRNYQFQPLAIAISLVLLTAVGIILLFQYSNQPRHDFKKNSLAYFLLLDAEIANIPWLKDLTDIHFTSIEQDGTAPGVNAVSIATPDLQGAKQAIANHFIHLGYAAQTQCEPACTTVWVKGDATISIYPEKKRLTVLKTRLIAK